MKRWIIVASALTIIVVVVNLRRGPTAPVAAPVSEMAGVQETIAETNSRPPEPLVIYENGQRISVPPKDVEPEAHVKPEWLWKERPWEKQVDEITASTASNDQKIDSLLKIFDALPREGQVHVTHEVIELSGGLRDDLLVELLMDDKKHETVTSVLLTEIVKRSNLRRLPVLLALAQREGHPNQAEAVELLELLLNKQHSTDWASWQVAVNETLTAAN